jgi:hypothetical protein
MFALLPPLLSASGIPFWNTAIPFICQTPTIILSRYGFLTLAAIEILLRSILADERNHLRRIIDQLVPVKLSRVVNSLR